MKAAHYLMTDVVESGYSNYWAVISGVKRDEEGYVMSFRIKDGGFENDPVNTKSVLVNDRAIHNAVKKLLTGAVEVRRDIAASFVGKVEDWDYDSDSGDCLMQTILFNEIVYG